MFFQRRATRRGARLSLRRVHADAEPVRCTCRPSRADGGRLATIRGELVAFCVPLASACSS